MSKCHRGEAAQVPRVPHSTSVTQIPDMEISFGCNVFTAGVWPDFELMLLVIHFKGECLSHAIAVWRCVAFYFILFYNLKLRLWT